MRKSAEQAVTPVVIYFDLSQIAITAADYNF